MDLATIGLWIIQGLILFAFATLGIVVGQRLLNRSTPSTPPPASVAAPPDAVAAAPAPLPATAPTGTAAAPAPPVSTPQGIAEELDVQNAVEFTEDGRMLLVMDMPASLLDDDRSLVDVWSDAVARARVEQQKYLRGEMPAVAGANALDPLATDPEVLGDQLNQVLNRLQLSAERRRRFHDLLSESFAAEDDR